jgi:site-specific recombinase XerD
MSSAESTPPSYRIRIAPTPDGSGRRGPPDLSPRGALERWLDKLRVDKTDPTVSAYHYRLKHFFDFCEEQGITPIGEVNGWDLETYETHRRAQGLKAISLNNEMGTLQNFLSYCADIELVDEALPDKIDPPSVPKGAGVSDVRLEAADAKPLLQYYRTTGGARYSREHVLLELFWYTGARSGAIRGADLEDYDPDGQYLTFVNRPDQDTRLKKGIDSQRSVALPDEVCDALDGYLKHTRREVYDDYGREPLLTTTQGRMSANAVRGHTYLATIPCLHSECPHGRDPETCEYIDYGQASQCPSSRSPHQIRTGSITWHLNCGWDIADVAEKVNASVRTIKQHYDQQSMRDEMEQRRREYVDRLSFDLENGGEK